MGEGITLASVLTDIGTVVTGIFGFSGTFLDKLTANPLTFTILAIVVIGAGLAFVFRLVRSC